MLNHQIAGFDEIMTEARQISQQMKIANVIKGLNEQARLGCITTDEYNNRIERLYKMMGVKW